jgi:hypothetical protein
MLLPFLSLFTLQNSACFSFINLSHEAKTDDLLLTLHSLKLEVSEILAWKLVRMSCLVGEYVHHFCSKNCTTYSYGFAISTRNILLVIITIKLIICGQYDKNLCLVFQFILMLLFQLIFNFIENHETRNIVGRIAYSVML